MDRSTGPSSSLGGASVPPGMFARKGGGPAAEGGVDATVTLAGTVELGVESRSIVLFDEAGSPLAQLSGRPATEYPVGTRVQVTGDQGSGTAPQQPAPQQEQQPAPGDGAGSPQDG